MVEQYSASPRFLPIAGTAILAAVLGFAGGWVAPLAGATRGANEDLVREYLLEHPQIPPEAMERLQSRDMATRLAPIRQQVKTPFPGAFLGNPDGKIVLVEFSDYACGYCRQSLAEVDALIAQNKDLKVVMRELPILSPASEQAARMALAAAQQGKYNAFHKEMFETGRPSAQTIDQAARKVGLDLDKAHAAMVSAEVTAEIQRNLAWPSSLGLTARQAGLSAMRPFPGPSGAMRWPKRLPAPARNDFP
jgi:protein-disulfide isomerase